MDKNIYDYIKEFELDEYIDEANISDFSLRTYEKDNFILMSGSNEKNIYFFLDGVAKVTLFSKDGEEMLLELIKPFDIFGDVEFMLGNEISYNVQAIEKSILFELNSNNINKNPKFYKLLAKTLAIKLAKISEKYSKNQLLGTKEYVLNFIKENKSYVSSSLKYNEMAKLVGLSERQLRRVLNELSEGNLIEKVGKKIILLKK